MADTTDPPTMANNTEPSSSMETKTQPLTANVARVLLLLRDLQRDRHKIDDPWIMLPLKLHEYDDLYVRIEKNDLIWGWVESMGKFSYDSRTSTFIIRKLGNMHAAFESQISCWIMDQLDAILFRDAQLGLLIREIVNTGNFGFPVQFIRPGNERGLISHNPDAQFVFSQRIFPTVVIEIANSPGSKSLSRLAKDYILHSYGKIQAVVGFKLNAKTKKVSLTVWRPHFYILPGKGPAVGVASETQIIRDEQGKANPAGGSGLRLMLRDFVPNDLKEKVDPDISILINSGELCRLLGATEERERKIAAGELIITPPQSMFCVEKWRETQPQPVYEEDKFVFSEEELKVHKRYLDSRGRYPGNMGKAGETAQRGRGSVKGED
ncbi:hypothetical protein V490_09410 [Pseudogymnoascus sp. VKM F-3557]|nr:hypothetical protein V490_09410 [Pseudogymnoascus sp. VKM F-3557]